MSGAMVPYVVRQGDYLAKLAFVHGFDADAVWSDPKNQALRELRKNPNILHPGDVVYIPVAEQQWLRLRSGGTNRYVVTVPKTEVRLTFMNPAGEPFANEPYEVHGLMLPPGRTDGEGQITLNVPVTIRELEIVFPQRNITILAGIGDLDPDQEASGIKQRLQNLGFFVPGGADEDRALRDAITAFQSRNGLAQTGMIDDATRETILDGHGD